MTDEERQKLDNIHAFLMEPTGPGRPSRAELVDDALAAISAGRLGARALLWLMGLVVTASATVAALRGGIFR